MTVYKFQILKFKVPTTRHEHWYCKVADSAQKLYIQSCKKEQSYTDIYLHTMA
jgi:hypothetical protein